MAGPVTTRAQGDLLTVGGYERVFGVLERCAAANSVTELKQRVVEAMSAVFRVRYATFFEGADLLGAFEDRDPMVPGGPREASLLREYQDRWRLADVYASPVARRLLECRGVAVLRDLPNVPGPFRRYVEEFLVGHGLAGTAALRLDLAGSAVGLVGLFDPDDRKITAEDRRALELVSRQLSAVSRRLPRLPACDVLANVTGRQRDVALLVGDGLTNADIGRRLHLAEDTVKKYVSRVLVRTGCRSRTELAVRLGQVSR